MNVLDKLVRNAAREAKRQVRLARHASEHGALDKWVLDDLMDESPAFRQALETPITYDTPTGVETYEPSADIHEDLFLGHHTPGMSRAKRAEQVKPSHQLGRDVLEAYFQTPEHRDLKPYTEADKLASAIAARAAKDVFDDMLRSDAMRDHVEQSQNLDDIENALEAWQQQIDDLRAQAQEMAANGQPIPAETTEHMKRLVKQREQTAQALGEAAANATPVPKPVMHEAVKAAGAKAEEMVDVWGALAGMGAGEFVRENPDDAFALTEQWMQLEDFREFCKLIGRVVRDFRSQDARNVIGGDEDIVGITQGNDLSLVLPSELARLGNPLTRRSFFRDFVDETLLQYETQGSEKVSNGPGVLCIDLSGSMGGRKAHEAKAVAVGFVRLMHRKRRDAVVICFNGAVMWEQRFPKTAKLDMRTLFDLASLRPSGGTDITNAVAKARHYIETAPAFHKADVLVVTDGQDRYEAADEAIRDHFRATGVRSHGIAIGHAPAPGGWLLQFCDDAISVEQLTEATGDIVRAVS